MFEIGEYWAMKKAEQEGLLNLDYSPSHEIEEQVRYAAGNGHDVQLHLHPWWIGAEFVNGTWKLNPQYQRISDLPNGIGNESDMLSVVGILSLGKKTLENMIQPICPDYECLVYRAAMFWGQPSKDLIAGLKKAGLIADSSVISGLYEQEPVPTDYRNAKSLSGYWWTNADDISQSGVTGENIIEFPVYSKLRPYICNLKWTKLSVTLKRRKKEKNDLHGHGMKKARQSRDSSGTIFKKLFSLQPVKYDFCKLSTKEMIKELKYIIDDSGLEDDSIGTPVVMLGHSKDFWNDRNVENFLKYVKNEYTENVRFGTFAELTNTILKKT